MDDLDRRLIAALRRDGRMSVSDLSVYLGVARGTVRARISALEETGEIVGFTVLTRGDVALRPVRGLMTLGIEGGGAEKIIARLRGMSEVEEIHTTNGAWDLVLQLGTESLERLDQVLFSIRAIPGVARSETNLLLSSRRGRRTS